ncbi:MAG: 16S rRNA processing protein RimM [Prevotella sp.]|nr:16S rRNA processing protein RimM [Prevotella sp.]
MIRKEDVYKIGRLGKPHGVRGEVTFQFNDDIFDQVDADYLILEIDGILVPFFMEEYRFRSDELALMKFEDIDTEDRARELTGCDVYFPRVHAEADEDHLTWSEIVGYQVMDAVSQQTVGTIVHVDDSTVNTLFEVKTGEGNDLLIPASDDMITDVDKRQRVITMEIPDGLLDL